MINKRKTQSINYSNLIIIAVISFNNSINSHYKIRPLKSFNHLLDFGLCSSVFGAIGGPVMWVDRAYNKNWTSSLSYLCVILRVISSLFSKSLCHTSSFNPPHKRTYQIEKVLEKTIVTVFNRVNLSSLNGRFRITESAPIDISSIWYILLVFSFFLF